MNLDDPAQFTRLDREKMIARIASLPESLASGWQAGQRLPLPSGEKPSQVVIGGIGSLATGAGALAAYLSPFLSVPLNVQR
ncbi:MAG: hypothetical protein L0Z70_16850, partial [Chloroflexi bacterium]|nr:hypothetical protein [Chloroflexota bacterium]